MLHYETIHQTTLGLLKKLASQTELYGMRLVGMARAIGDLKVFNRTKNILQFVLNNVRIDVVDYANYEWIDEPVIEDGIVLASSKDIAALKINAIECRGTKKDFIDIFELLMHYELSEILDFYRQKILIIQCFKLC